MNPDVLNALQAKFGTSDYNAFQILRGFWYDTVRLNPAGTSQIQFFTIPLGGTDPVSGQGKTLEQTNFVKQGSIGQTYYLLENFRTQVSLVPKNRQPLGAVSGDTRAVTHGLAHQATSYFTQLATLLRRGVLNIGFAQKQYFTVGQPFLDAPPGFGVDVMVAPEDSIAGDAIRGGTWIFQDNRFKNIWQTSPAQLIEPEITINASIDFPGTSGGAASSPVFTNTFLTDAGAQSTPAVDILLVFDGYIIRPNQ